MLRVVLAIGLFITCATVSGWAQTVDQAIVITHGRQQVLTFKNPANTSVGNVNVVYIQSVKPSEVIIFGAGIGESFLEVTEHNGQKKRFIVRVVSAQASEAHPSSTATVVIATTRKATAPGTLSSPAPLSHTMPLNQSAAEADIPSTKLSGAGTETVSPVKATSTPPPPIKPSARPQARASRLSRLEISADTFYQSDREDVRLVSAELADVKELRKVVAESATDRLAAKPQREQTMTLRRSAMTTTFSLSYDVNARNSLTVAVPFIRRQDEVIVGNGSVRTSGQGLGDIQVRFARSYPRLFKTAWSGTAELNLGLPTGKSVYDTGEDQSPLGIGHYEVGAIAGVRRIFDPFIFNAAGGLSYTLPRNVGEARITPGLGYSAQTGFGYALSDRWVLSEQLGYTRRPNVFLSTATDAQTESIDQSFLSHSLIYRPRGGHSLRLMFNLGLNAASPDRGFGFTYAYRRKDQAPE